MALMFVECVAYADQDGKKMFYDKSSLVRINSPCATAGGKEASKTHEWAA